MFIILSAAQTYIARFRIKELHQVLKRLGLSIGGLKTALVQRLVNYISRPGGRAASAVPEEAERVRELASTSLLTAKRRCFDLHRNTVYRLSCWIVALDSLSLRPRRSATCHEGAASAILRILFTLSVALAPQHKCKRATLMSGDYLQRILCAKCTSRRLFILIRLLLVSHHQRLA